MSVPGDEEDKEGDGDACRNVKAVDKRAEGADADDAREKM